MVVLYSLADRFNVTWISSYAVVHPVYMFQLIFQGCRYRYTSYGYMFIRFLHSSSEFCAINS